jgi:phosphatidylglycerophosphatase A
MPKPDIRNPVHLVAAGFGSGLAPRAPGTFGSLAALLPWWPLHFLPPLQYWLAIALGAALGIAVCGRTARDLRTHDHGAIVWDEFIGLWIALAAIPTAAADALALGAAAAGFALFRLFDIWKPWPISWCDRRIRGGFGIMLDDVLAGLLALAVLSAGLQVSGLLER